MQDAFANNYNVGLSADDNEDISRCQTLETEQGKSRQGKAVAGDAQKDALNGAKGVKNSNGNGTRMRDPTFFKNLVSRSFGDDYSRHLELHDQENSGDAGNITEPSGPHLQENEQVENKLSGPTYDFSLHSSSMSPPSLHDEQYWSKPTNARGGGPQQHRVGDGSLVTHKPRRLHKKILNSLRSGIKKSRKNIR